MEILRSSAIHCLPTKIPVGHLSVPYLLLAPATLVRTSACLLEAALPLFRQDSHMSVDRSALIENAAALALGASKVLARKQSNAMEVVPIFD